MLRSISCVFSLCSCLGIFSLRRQIYDSGIHQGSASREARKTIEPADQWQGFWYLMCFYVSWQIAKALISLTRTCTRTTGFSHSVFRPTPRVFLMRLATLGSNYCAKGALHRLFLENHKIATWNSALLRRSRATVTAILSSPCSLATTHKDQTEATKKRSCLNYHLPHLIWCFSELS